MRLTEREVVAAVDSLSLRRLRLWVREGWIVPSAGERGPLFDEVDMARIRLVCQLKDDLAIPHDTLPVVLSLMDQVHGLRRELRALARAVDREPEEVRRRIRGAYHGGE